MPADRCRFGPFEFDARTLDLRRNGTPIRLQHQPKRVLACLLRNADRTVSREELRKEVWGEGTFVDFDRGLNYCIAQIRSALGDDASRSIYVQTIAKEGYRWVAPIVPSPSGEGGALRLDSGQAPRRVRGIAIAAVAFIAIAIAATFALHATRAKEPVPIVAIARFDNETGNASMTRFSDALTDNFVERLTTLSDGRYAVIGNAQILRRPRDQRDLKAIASSLHARFIILGQVFGSEQDGLVLIHLIRMPDQTHITVSRLDRPRMEPLAIAQKVATKFSRRLIDQANVLNTR
ncbi:MAG TPA: winged helix-turn-helix domain-containing protein [Thermoanaerobaculia bacterium]|nr:winged helix-turn-helix domain-containing protein [Thermoanaerobaculia bacterium]